MSSQNYNALIDPPSSPPAQQSLSAEASILPALAVPPPTDGQLHVPPHVPPGFGDSSPSPSLLGPILPPSVPPVPLDPLSVPTAPFGAPPGAVPFAASVPPREQEQSLQQKLHQLQQEIARLKLTHAPASTWGESRRDLPACPLTLPEIKLSGANAAIMTRAALAQYHDAITQRGYSNSRGTLEVLYEIERAPGVPPALLTSIAQYTKTEVRPGGTRDERLWACFMELFNRVVYIDEVAHMGKLNSAMQMRRQPGQPVHVYIANVQAALRMYIQQSYPHPPPEAYLTTSLLPLLGFDGPLATIKLQIGNWLRRQNPQQITLDALSHNLAQYTDIPVHIAAEKNVAGGRRSYLLDAAESEIALPPVSSMIDRSRSHQPSSDPWLPQWKTRTPGFDADAVLRQFNVATTSSRTSLGLNKFPRNVQSRPLHARMSAMRMDIKHRLGVDCGRCFRKICRGSKVTASGEAQHTHKALLNTHCADKNDANFLADDLVWVIFNVLKFLHVGGSAEEAKAHYATFVQTFYASEGSIPARPYVTHLQSMIRASLSESVGKQSGFSYASLPSVEPSPSVTLALPPSPVLQARVRPSSSLPLVESLPLPPWPVKHALPSLPLVDSLPLPPLPVKHALPSLPTTFPFPSPPVPAMSSLQSHLSWNGPMANLPDLGNPHKLAGVGWWRDYKKLLAKVGLADLVRSAASSEHGSFGDGPATRPEMVLLQVPFWYDGPKGSVLVLDNVRIVKNHVGLLDGKHNLSALGFECKLRAKAGATTFRIKGQLMHHYDGGQHFFLQLGIPTFIRKQTAALSIQRETGGSYRAVSVPCALTQMQKGPIGDEPSLTTMVACHTSTNDKPPQAWPWLLSPDLPSYVHTSETQRVSGAVQLATPATDPKPLTIADFVRLHRAWGHVPVSVMEQYLLRGGYAKDDITALARRFDCQNCPGKPLGAPARPRSAVHNDTGPGQSGHVDVGHFHAPTTGPFSVMVVADAFSNHLFGDVVRENGASVAEAYVSRVPENYQRVSYDLAGFARGDDFVDFMASIGVAVHYLPADCHWGSGAETGMHLLRTALSAVFAELPDMAPTLAVQLALTRINTRPYSNMPSLSRRAVQYGRDVPETEVAVLLNALPTTPLRPPFAELQTLRDTAKTVHSRHDMTRVRSRVRRALSSHAAPFPTLHPGDRYLYYHTKGVAKRDRGWRGPVTMVGMVGTTVLGYFRGALCSTHRSRCYPLTRGASVEKSKQVYVPPWVLDGRLPLTQQHPEPLEAEDLDALAPDPPAVGNDMDLDLPLADLGLASEPPVLPMPEVRAVVADPNTLGLPRREVAPLPLPPLPVTLETPSVALPLNELPLPPLRREVPLPLPPFPVTQLTPSPDAVPAVLASPVASPSGLSEEADVSLSGQSPSADAVVLTLPAAEAPLTPGLASPLDAPNVPLTPVLASPLDVPHVLSAAAPLPEHVAAAVPNAAPVSAAVQNEVPSVSSAATPLSRVSSAAAPLSRVSSAAAPLPLPEHEHEHVPDLADTDSDTDTDEWSEDDEVLILADGQAIRQTHAPDPAAPATDSWRDDDAAEDRQPLKRRADPDDEETTRGSKRVRAFARKQRVHWKEELETVLGTESHLPHAWSATSVVAYHATPRGLVPCRVHLTNKARRRTVVMDYADAAHMPEMKRAMEKEIESFKTMGCVEEVPFAGLSEQSNCVSTKWVLAIKTTEQGTKKYKARLVARGFEDLMKGQVTRDAPVASAASQRMVLQACVEAQFRINSWDFTCAFLQGKPIERDVFIMPPVGYGIPSGKVWRLKRPVYGLTSAPKAWYDRLVDAMERAGLDSNVTDEGVLRMLTKTGEICGILALHVDDTIGGGTEEFHNVMKTVNDELEIGAHERDNFHYKGLRVKTVWPDEHKFELTLDGDEYLDAAEPMLIPEGSEETLLSVTQRTDFRSVAGCIGYCAQAFRPELALECSILGRHFLAPTIRHAKIANQILAWTKANRYPLCFRTGACEAITVFCDSSGPSEHGTQGGRIAVMTDRRGHQIGGFLHWESQKVKRVCKSTTTGETLSAGEGHELGMWLQQCWLEMTGHKLPLRLVVDSEGLSHNVTTTKLPLQKRLRIDMACLRQGLRRGEFTMTWVPSAANISDPLTKSSNRSSHELMPPHDATKRGLLLALKTNCAYMDGVSQVTKSQADVSNY